MHFRLITDLIKIFAALTSMRCLLIPSPDEDNKSGINSFLFSLHADVHHASVEVSCLSRFPSNH